MAFCLRGASEGDNDIYAMFNSYWEPIEFEIQEGRDWKLVVDTFAESPQDFMDENEAPGLARNSYVVGPRSVAVLIR